MTEAEMGERARDWTEILIGVVPESYLQPAYERAAQSHSSNFPLTAFELKTAYEALYAEEMERVRKIRFEQSLDLDAEYHSPHWKPCEMCYGCGFAETTRTDETGKTYPGVVKCYSCNYWELYRQKHGL